MCEARMPFRRMSSTNAIAKRHPERSSTKWSSHVVCHPASLVIGFAVITRSVSSTKWSSASPSSFEEGHHLRCNLYRCRIARTVPTTITKHPNQSKFIIGKISAERMSISRLLLPPSFTERSIPSFDS